jgi:hypothetical protein
MSAMSAVDHHSAELNGIAPGWRHAGHPGKPTAADMSLVGKKEHGAAGTRGKLAISVP